MRTDFWPEEPADHPVEIEEYFRGPPEDAVCLVAEMNGEVVGFAEVGTRPYAEGCRTSPVGYLEGIFVSPDARQSGVGQALVTAAEEWCGARGYTEMASDRALDNETSGAFHEAVGFTEVHRLVCYRRVLVR